MQECYNRSVLSQEKINSDFIYNITDWYAPENAGLAEVHTGRGSPACSFGKTLGSYGPGVGIPYKAIEETAVLGDRLQSLGENGTGRMKRCWMKDWKNTLTD